MKRCPYCGPPDMHWLDLAVASLSADDDVRAVVAGKLSPKDFEKRWAWLVDLVGATRPRSKKPQLPQPIAADQFPEPPPAPP